MTNDTIGVDISKDRLDAHRMSDGASRCFVNDSCGHTAFVKWLDGTGLRIGTVRNSVREAMMMERSESSHGYRERIA